MIKMSYNDMLKYSLFGKLKKINGKYYYSLKDVMVICKDIGYYDLSKTFMSAGYTYYVDDSILDAIKRRISGRLNYVNFECPKCKCPSFLEDGKEKSFDKGILELEFKCTHCGKVYLRYL